MPLKRLPKFKRVDENEFVFTYDGIAAEADTSASTLKRFLNKEGLTLSKWGYGRTSPVYMSKGVIRILKTSMFRLRWEKHLPESLQ